MKKILALFVLVLIVTSPYYLFHKKYDDFEIRLGMSGPFSGASASLGREFLLGAESYFKFLNESGGVYGRSIHIVNKDDKYEPKIALENVNNLIKNEKVFALFGVIGTSVCQEVFPIAMEKSIPFIGAFSGAEFLRNPPNPLVLNARASDMDETEALIKYFVDTLHLSKISVFYQNDTYGRAGLHGVQKALQKRGLQTVSEGSYKRNTLSIGNALYEIEIADPEVIVIVSSTEPASEFIARAKKSSKIRPSIKFAPLSFVEPQEIVRDMSPEVSENIVFSQVVPSPWDSKIKEVENYRQLMKKYFPKESLSYVSLEGYFAARMISKVFQTIGKDFTKEDFIQESAKLTKRFDEKGPRTNRDEQCTCLHKAHLSQYINGNFQTVGDDE
ncbi:MAG: ABC transporter substrate-binding protein [Sulfurospirillaceae bacterium]|nr:ABC transporter substrate-binding protein [Sulfurospirillaceae bacterium]